MPGNETIAFGLALRGEVADLHELGEFLVGAEPGEAASGARIAWSEVGLVPDDPLVDLSVVVLDGLVHVLAEKVVRVVEGEVKVPGDGALAVSRIGRGPGWRELQQAGDEGFAYQGSTVFQSAFGGKEVSVILERESASAARRIDYKLLATSRTSTMQSAIS